MAVRAAPILVSIQGTRRTQMDAVGCARAGDVTALCVCDGMGSEPDSARVADAVCTAALDHCRAHLNAPADLAQPDGFVRALNDRLETTAAGLAMRGTGATTFALALVGSAGALAVWRGDSRVYAASRNGLWHTPDHADPHGYITRYFRGGAPGRGPAEACRIDLDGCFAVAAVSDGVSGPMRRDALHRYLAALTHRPDDSRSRHEERLEDALGDGLADNASLAFLALREA